MVKYRIPTTYICSLYGQVPYNYYIYLQPVWSSTVYLLHISAACMVKYRIPTTYICSLYGQVPYNYYIYLQPVWSSTVYLLHISAACMAKYRIPTTYICSLYGQVPYSYSTTQAADICVNVGFFYRKLAYLVGYWTMPSSFGVRLLAMLNFNNAPTSHIHGSHFLLTEDSDTTTQSPGNRG